MADRASYPGMPRWVKVCGVLALIVLALFVAVHLLGGGMSHHVDHGGTESPPRVDIWSTPRSGQ